MNIKLLVPLTALIFINFTVQARVISIDDGKTIFTARCASCHNINVKVVGPALANVDQRRSIDWIIKFVHSSQTLVKGNDREAVALFNQFDNTVMPDHADLSGDQIQSIIAYIKSQVKTAAIDNAPFARPGQLAPNYLPVSISNYGFFGTYIALVLLMIACFSVAAKVKEMERENNNNQHNDTEIF